MKGPHCTEVHLDGRVMEAVSQKGRKTHERLFVSWQFMQLRKTTPSGTQMAVLTAEVKVATLGRQVRRFARQVRQVRRFERQPFIRANGRIVGSVWLYTEMMGLLVETW